LLEQHRSAPSGIDDHALVLEYWNFCLSPTRTMAPASAARPARNWNTPRTSMTHIRGRHKAHPLDRMVQIRGNPQHVRFIDETASAGADRRSDLVFRSSTSVAQPFRASVSAAASPAGPPPAMIDRDSRRRYLRVTQSSILRMRAGTL
jgi:hypothetical protein